ncbi:MAG: hypothetical protein KF708_01610 [Pirellulales bacterium]|nr:hypothetical protein [Pirellulales bacterium]
MEGHLPQFTLRRLLIVFTVLSLAIGGAASFYRWGNGFVREIERDYARTRILEEGWDHPHVRKLLGDAEVDRLLEEYHHRKPTIVP